MFDQKCQIGMAAHVNMYLGIRVSTQIEDCGTILITEERRQIHFAYTKIEESIFM